MSLFQRFKHREIKIDGFVRAQDAVAFEKQLNELKIYSLDHEVDLTVNYLGHDIVYKVSMMDFDPDRKHLPNFANYELKLVAVSPFGVGTEHGSPDTGVFLTDAISVPNINNTARTFYIQQADDIRPSYFIRPIIEFYIEWLTASDEITHFIVGNPANEELLTFPVSGTLVPATAPRVELIPVSPSALAFNIDNCFIIDCVRRLLLRGDPDGANVAAYPDVYGRGVIPRWSPVGGPKSIKFCAMPTSARVNLRYRIRFKKEFCLMVEVDKELYRFQLYDGPPWWWQRLTRKNSAYANLRPNYRGRLKNVASFDIKEERNRNVQLVGVDCQCQRVIAELYRS